MILLVTIAFSLIEIEVDIEEALEKGDKLGAALSPSFAFFFLVSILIIETGLYCDITQKTTLLGMDVMSMLFVVTATYLLIRIVCVFVRKLCGQKTSFREKPIGGSLNEKKTSHLIFGNVYGTSVVHVVTDGLCARFR